MIGVQKSNIILQFSLEAVVLNAMSGVVGIIFGCTISLISRLIFFDFADQRSALGGVLGLIVSAETGLF